ncbi:MAG TPA: hypothetical protein VKP08_20040, partial [Anaerolineales bacterium]|nr:hypothetical protein [Anaerolineales bacterium]
MKQNRPLIILLLLSFVIAILTLNNYGESWDEMKLYRYADDSLEAYGTWFRHGMIPVTGDRFENYGPAFLMVTRLITKALTRIIPGLKSVDVQHLVYFVMFLLGMWAFHQLAARWMSRNAAFGATLLFMSQPVFWGHAFINPKDIPLLSLFLLAVYLGLRMHDTIFRSGTGSVFDSVSTAWKELTPRTRRLLIGAALSWLVFLLIFFGGTPLIHQWIDNAVRAAARGEPSLLPLIATRIQRIAPEIYIEKFFVLFLRVRLVAFLLVTGALIWFYRRRFPSVLRTLGLILPAGIIIGLAVSIRIFGAWAGVLVAGYILWKSGLKSWLVIAVYALIGILAMYLTWPYLWPDPLGHFWETVTIMSNHPWPSSVLFNGETYRANNLPGYYVPLLLVIQLTEPVWVLFLAGLAAAIYGAVK